MSFHNTTDNPSRYEDPKEHEEARTRDPIERVQRYLARLGLWDETKAAAMTDEVREENERALQLAFAAEAPRPDDLFANVYADLPPRVARQKADFLDGGG
jgi:pyruvate dehydrogenase E1 component alpha subunit